MLSSPCGGEDLEAVAHGDVLEVTRRSGDVARRLFVGFADVERHVGEAGGWDVLLEVSGGFRNSTLGPRGAVLLER